MRFLVDANLSPRIVAILTASGHDGLHVRDVGLLTAGDEKIMAFAQADSRVIVSADSDFATMLALGGMAVPTDLASGAVVSLSTTHLRIRRLPL